MSFNGIFHPLVRNYFEDKYSGGGGGESTGAKVMLIESMDDVECVIPAGVFGEAEYYRISGDTPTVDELMDGYIGFMAANVGGLTKIGRIISSVEDSSADAGFPFYSMLDETGHILIFVCGIDNEDEGLFVKAGTYIMSEFTAFPNPTMIVYGL